MAAKRVAVSGYFDPLHVGHLDYFELAKELGGLRGRLNNPKFAASAPADVVAETRANLVMREEEESTIRQAIARLDELG